GAARVWTRRGRPGGRPTELCRRARRPVVRQNAGAVAHGALRTVRVLRAGRHALLAALDEDRRLARAAVHGHVLVRRLGREDRLPDPAHVLARRVTRVGKDDQGESLVGGDLVDLRPGLDHRDQIAAARAGLRAYVCDRPARRLGYVVDGRLVGIARDRGL